MLRAVIADDEMRIIKLIRHLVNWDELGITLVGEAQDGIDAFNMVHDLKPDILITDICMPGIDGLELAKRINGMKLDVSMIMISGYKQFDYAYNALKFGVEDFIIKPINQKEINNALIKISHKLRENERHEDDVYTMQQQLDDSTTKVRKLFIEESLNLGGYEGSLQELNREYFYNFEPEMFMGIILQFDLIGRGESNNSTILEKAERIMQDTLMDKCIEKETIIQKDRVVCLINIYDSKKKSILRQVRKCYDIISTEFGIYGGLKFTIGIGNPYNELNKIGKTLSEALTSVQCKCVLGSSRIITADEIGIQENGAELQEEWLNRLYMLVESHGVDQIPDWVHRVFGGFCDDYSNNPWQAVLLSIKLRQEFKDMCINMDITIEENLWDRWKYELSRTNSLDDLQGTLIKGITDILTLSYEKRRLRESYPIILAKEYINSHIYEPINVEDIAKAVSLSYGYFSSLFKQETGMNISDYLVEIRIEEAKKLLKNTLLNISEIATRLGYKDSRHFSKLFLKVVGVRPREYRKLYAR